MNVKSELEKFVLIILQKKLLANYKAYHYRFDYRQQVPLVRKKIARNVS